MQVSRTLAALLVAALAAGCSEDPASRQSQPQLPGPEGSPPTAVTPARYTTDVTFVPFSPDGPRLHFRFRHRTSPGSLRRDYRAWRATGRGWDALLRHRDSLPVPRAGWRVLPAPGLRVVVSEGEEIGGLVLRDTAGTTRVEAGETLAAWSSPTGQRERLARGAVEVDGRRRTGLVVTRRSALPTDSPPPRGLYGLLLLASPGGDGLVVVRQGGTPPGASPSPVDTTAAAHAWLGGEPQSWSRVRLEAVTESGDPGRTPPPGWTVRVAEAGLRGRITTGPVVPAGEGRTSGGRAGAASDPPEPGAPAAGAAGARLRLYTVAGTLRVAGTTLEVQGLGVEEGEP